MRQVGTRLCIPSQGGFDLGKIASLELNHKPVQTANRGESVAMKIESTNTAESSRLYGRHFDFKVWLSEHSMRKPLIQVVAPDVTGANIFFLTNDPD